MMRWNRSGAVSLSFGAVLASCASCLTVACSSSAPASSPAPPPPESDAGARAIDASPDTAPPGQLGYDAAVPDSGFVGGGCGCQGGYVALTAVAGQPCTFSWAASTPFDFNLASVEVTNEDGDGGVHLLPRDPTNGWDYDDPSKPTEIVLHGAACTDFTAAKSPQITLILGCYAIAVPPC